MRLRAGRSVPDHAEAPYAAVGQTERRSDSGFPREISYTGCE